MGFWIGFICGAVLTAAVALALVVTVRIDNNLSELSKLTKSRS